MTGITNYSTGQRMVWRGVLWLESPLDKNLPVRLRGVLTQNGYISDTVSGTPRKH